MTVEAPAKAPRTPRAAKSTTAVAVRPQLNVVSIQQQLKAQAEAMGSRVAPASGNKISCNADKTFGLPDGNKVQGPIDLVVLDFITHHAWYPAAYNKNDKTAPGCFAIGTDPKNMVPSPNAPEKQSTTCNTCPMNEFESGQGNAKACKQTRKMAVLPPDAADDDPIWLLQSSPKANKGFDAYVASVARTYHMPPIAVISTVDMDPTQEHQLLTFGNAVPNPRVNELFGRQAEAMDLLKAEPDVSNYQAAKPAARKAVGRR